MDSLKNKLINKIQDIQDESLLKEVYRLLEIEYDDIELYKFDEEQLEAIKEARQQIKNGQVTLHEEAKKKIDEWLNK